MTLGLAAELGSANGSINALVSVCVAQKAVSTGPVATCAPRIIETRGAGQVVGRWVKPK